MREYIFQMKLYTIYFLKVSFSNKPSYFYSLGLPTIMLYLQLSFQNLNIEHINLIITSWLTYMIINHALTFTFKVSFLREQGYLKQFHTIVKHKSIFLISQALAGLINLAISSILLILLGSIMMNISFIYLVLKTIFVILLIYLPLIMLFSLLLRFQLRYQTIVIIQNIASSVLMFLTFITQNFMPFGFNRLLFFISPITLTMELFSILIEADILNLFTQIIPVLIVYMLIGILSLNRINILPVEGIL